jgi:bacteriocin-like protein
MKKHNKDQITSDDQEISELAMIDDLAISPLSDDELAAVTGGGGDSTTVASCSCCVAGATNHTPKTSQ